jgi:hypothetical protein
MDIRASCDFVANSVSWIRSSRTTRLVESLSCIIYLFTATDDNVPVASCAITIIENLDDPSSE